MVNGAVIVRVALLILALLASSTSVACAEQEMEEPTLSTLQALAWPGAPPTPSAPTDMWRLYSAGGTELYCRAAFTAEDVSARQVGVNRLSIEHVYPASLIARHFGFRGRTCEHPRPNVVADRSACVAALGDLHNEWPAYERLNQSRSTAKFGELVGEGTSDHRWQPFCPDFERQRAPRPAVVEPTLHSSGDIARTLLYMHFVYDLPLDTVVTDPNILLRWHQADPPDAEERRRETAIVSLQHGAPNPLMSR